MLLLINFVGISIVAGDCNIHGLPHKDLAVFGVIRSPSYVAPPPITSSSNFYGSMFAVILVNLNFVEAGAKSTNNNTTLFHKNKINANHERFGVDPLLIILPADQVCSM